MREMTPARASCMESSSPSRVRLASAGRRREQRVGLLALPALAARRLKPFSGRLDLSGYSSAGIWPPVCAKFLLTMRQRPSMRDSVRKLTNDSVPQNPSSTTVALAASPA